MSKVLLPELKNTLEVDNSRKLDRNSSLQKLESRKSSSHKKVKREDMSKHSNKRMKSPTLTKQMERKKSPIKRVDTVRSEKTNQSKKS